MSGIEIFIHFALGFATSFVGSIPFGSINLAVIRISIAQNSNAAFRFILGATFAEFFYSFISIHFSAFLLAIPKLEFYIKITSIPIFLIMGGMYFFAKRKEESAPSESGNRNYFLQGLTVGFLNPLQIPFWLAYGTYFLSVGWIKENFILLNIFIAGIIFGSSVLLLIIAKSATHFREKFSINEGRTNKITGGVFVLLALFQVIVVL